jgi:hypothetical protein
MIQIGRSIWLHVFLPDALHVISPTRQGVMTDEEGDFTHAEILAI